MAAIEFIEFARIVLDAIEALEIEYCIGGSMAVWAWGDQRTTRDFDVVIDLPPEKMFDLSKELEKRDMLVPFDIILDLYLMNEGDLPINALHLHATHKAELFLLRPGDTFRQQALARRKLVTISEELQNVYVHSPEDLIIYKLRYYKLSNQPKHTRDIQTILDTMAAQVDFPYIEHWVRIFDLANEWHRAQHIRE